MSHENPSPFAAYAPPAAAAADQAAESDYGAHRPRLKKFRRQMLALGALWTLMGALGTVAGAMIVIGRLGLVLVDFRLVVDYSNEIGGLVAATGAIWFLAGVGALFRKREAVVAGLAFSYLSVVGDLIALTFNGGWFALPFRWAPVVAIGLTSLVIIQAHRVLRFASQLRAAGVPLDTKP